MLSLESVWRWAFYGHPKLLLLPKWDIDSLEGEHAQMRR